ncbi:MAG TPA: hypothetical protein VL443_05480 [Cyclobacteriaceae bacterium]|jgi:hypothetical protein|nr:hypothetical protein [Cyclobacteriaceae bacterium]
MKSNYFNITAERTPRFNDALERRRRIIKCLKILEEQRTLDFIKDEFLKSSIKNDKWRFCGIQTSLEFNTIGTSLITEIFETRKRLILTDVYRLVFELNHPYSLVHQALLELVEDLNMQDQLANYVQDPVTLMIHAVHEYSHNNDLLVSTSLLINKLQSIPNS